MEQTLPRIGNAGVGEVFDTVHARVLRFFPELVEHLGGAPDDLLREVGLDREPPADGRSVVTYRQLAVLMQRASTALQCPDFGMRLAELQQGDGMFGPLGRVMRHSRTFGDAISYVSRHAHAHSTAARIWLKPNRADRTVFVGHDILLNGVRNKAQMMEQLLLSGRYAALEITGGWSRVRAVCFRHQPVSSARAYRRYFGCDVLFGQGQDGVFFSERDLARPIVNPDAKAYEAAVAFIDEHFTHRRPPLQAEVRGMIMQRLAVRTCTSDWIARALNMHPRTLHRRLSAEGASFQKIKDDVRRDVMLYYIQQTDLDFTSISEKLGFAEQSVMTRTCNQWFSMSPTLLRARSREEALAD